MQISTYLMNGHSHEGACFNLGYCASGESILSVFSNINVAGQLRSPALVHNVRRNFGVTNDGSVLLAGTNTCAVSRNGGID
jgi:hypothetical protein